MSAHTPGPWRLVTTNYGPQIAGESPGYLATTRGMFALKPEPEEMANARLIAAAPELLCALQVLLEIPQLHGKRAFSAMPFIERARAAISKAKGEDA